MIRVLNRQRFPRAAVSLALMLVALSASSGVAAAEDPWWGRDKALHLSISGVLSATGYGVASLFMEPRWQRATAGGAFALSIGIAKELYDLAGYGQPSYKDLLFDVAGTGLGLALAYLVDLALSDGSENDSGEAALALRQPLMLRF